MFIPEETLVCYDAPEPKNDAAFRLHNRRYLGCKFQLLPFIERVVAENCPGASSFADLFGGTGSVAWRFNGRYRIIVNDTLFHNYLAYRAFFSTESASLSKIVELINLFNKMDCADSNYYVENFADTYLSADNARKVGVIRDKIDDLEKTGKINFREKAILVTSLLYAIDRIANTVGHYDAWRRNGDRDKRLALRVPLLDDSRNVGNEIFMLDANRLAGSLKVDVAYLDPPYNSRQYCDCYHFLENVA